MLGKNNQYKFQKLSQDQKIKKKMKKKGKQWRTITLTVTALGFGFFSFTSMTTHADQTTVQQENKDAQSNQASEVHTSEAPVSLDAHHDETTHEQPQASAPTNQDKVTSPDASQSDHDKDKPQADAKATTKQDDNKVTPSNVVTDQQANGQDNSHDQKNNIDNADQSKQTQPSSEQDDHKPDNTGQDKVTVAPQSTPVAKKWDEQKVQLKEENPQDQAHKDDKVAPKLDTMKINGVDKVSVAVQNPQGQVITHLPLNQDQLPQDYNGKTPLTFAQVKAATGTVKSSKGQRDNIIPAPDKDGNYNWNADQFAAAKAQNAVHSGTWGTAQWFIDKDNNLFVSNGSLDNQTYSNVSSVDYSISSPNDVQKIGDYEGWSSNFGGGTDYSGKIVDADHSKIDNDYKDYDDVNYSGDGVGKATNNVLHSSDMGYVFAGEVGKTISVGKNYITSNKNDTSANGLAASIAKYVGRDNIFLNSINFTSAVSLPNNSSNLFSSHLGNNYVSNYNGYYTYQASNSVGNVFLTRTDNSYKTDYHYYNVSSTTNMTIGKITGYSNMNTSQTTNMNNMFGGQAVDPDVSGFDFSNTTDVSNMAAGTHMTNLDLSHSDLSKVTDFSNMANTPTLRTANLNNDTIQNSSNKANMLNGNVQEVSFNNKDTNLDNLGLSFNNWVNADNLGAKPITTSQLTNGTSHSGTWVVPNSPEYYQILNDASESDQDKILDAQTPQIADNNQSAAQTIQKQVDKTKSLLDNTDAQDIVNAAYGTTSNMLSNNQQSLDAFKQALSDYQQNKSIKTRKALTDARNKLISSNQELNDQINKQMQANSDAIMRQKLANISDKANEIANENLNTQSELNDQLSDIKSIVKDGNILNNLNNVASGVNEIVGNVKADEINLNKAKSNDEINQALDQLNKDNGRLKYAVNLQSKINSSAFIQQEVVDANDHAEMVKNQYINYKNKITNPDIKDKFNQAIDEFNDLENKLNLSHNGLLSILTSMNVLGGNDINTNSINDLGNNINNAKNQLSDSINNLNNSSKKNSTAFTDFIQQQAVYDIQNTVNQAKTAQQKADDTKEQQDMAAQVSKDQAELQNQINTDNSKMDAQSKAAAEDKANALAQKTAEDTQKLNQMIEQTKSDAAKKEQQDLDKKDAEDQAKLNQAVSDATDAQRRADATKEQQDMAAQVAKDKAELQDQINSDNAKMDAQSKAAAEDKANALAQKTAEDTQKLNQMIAQTKSDDAKKEQQDMADKDAKHQQELQDAVAQAKLAQQKADSSQEQQDMADQIQKDTDQLNTKLKEQADADNAIMNSQKAADQQAAIDKVQKLLTDDTNKLNQMIAQTKLDDAKKEQQDLDDKDKSDNQRQQDAVDKAKQEQQQQDAAKEQQDLANQIAQQNDAISKATQAQQAADSSKAQQDLVQQISKDKSDLQNQMNEDNKKLNDKDNDNKQLQDELAQKTQQLNDLTYKLNKMIGQSNQSTSSNAQPTASGYNTDSLNVQTYSIPSDNRYDDLKSDQANKLKQDAINARHLKTYIQPNEVTENNNTVTLSKDIYVHTGKDFYHDQKLRKIKAGQQLKVLRVIKYKGITRFELADHTYITTNRSFVKLGK